MNKNYYEFIFMGDQGKNITLRITNAIGSQSTTLAVGLPNS